MNKLHHLVHDFTLLNIWKICEINYQTNLKTFKHYYSVINYNIAISPNEYKRDTTSKTIINLITISCNLYNVI